MTCKHCNKYINDGEIIWCQLIPPKADAPDEEVIKYDYYHEACAMQLGFLDKKLR